MIKEIRVVNKEKGIIQCTSISERWYAFPGEDKETGLPKYIFLPSSTWISSYYPKSEQFYVWLMTKGKEAEEIKVAAGQKGTRVHQACELLERDLSLSIDASFKNEETQMMETLTTQEIECIFSFSKWHNDNKPQLLANEMTVLGEFYAGTLDRIYRINGEIWIVDLKTSKSIWEEQKLQVSSYKHANIDYKALNITDIEWEGRKMAILQLGYTLNKAGYKFTEIEDKFELFCLAYKIFQNENPESKPKQKDFPLVLTINKETANA